MNKRNESTAERVAALSVSILDRAGHIASMQTAVLRAFGVKKIGRVTGTESVLADLLAHDRDVLIVNWLSKGEDWMELIEAVRSKQHCADPFVGVLVIAPDSYGERVKAMLNAGVNSYLGMPFTPTDLRRHLTFLVRRDWVFVDSPAYFGPDRRRGGTGGPLGDERRGPSDAKILSGETLERTRDEFRRAARAAARAAKEAEMEARLRPVAAAGGG